MKVTSGILGSHSGTRLLWITVLVSLALGITLALLLTRGSVAADGQDEFTAPIVLEEIRTPPKVLEPPSVREQRQVQGQGASITQQTSGTLVSNLKQGNADIDLTSDHAQWFGTGSNSQGYKLTSVEMIMKSTVAKPSYTVSIWSGDAGPSTQVGKNLVNPTLTSAWNTVDFAATGSGIDLTNNKTYWVVIDSSVSNADTDIRVTASNNEDSAAPGWSIGNVRRHRPFGDTTWGTTLNTNVVKIAVIGYAIVKPGLVSAEVNGTSLVLTYDNGLDTASRTAARQFGIKLGGGALQRATAISISGRQVTLTVPEVRAGQVVTVSYTKPTSNPLKGSTGPEVDAIVDQPVTVNTAPAYGRLPESGKVRDAVYVTYNNADGEQEAVENRAASADRETLYDYFYDSCSAVRSLTTVHDYSQHTEIVTPSGATRTVMTQARNGWKWVWVQDANGAVTGTRPETVSECASHGMYLRQQNCANEEWLRRNPHLHEGTCPDDRTW